MSSELRPKLKPLSSAAPLPGYKAAEVTELQRAGKRVAMVGDGVNRSVSAGFADGGQVRTGGEGSAGRARTLEDVSVDVVLLYFDGCPNWQMAHERLQEALGRAGRADVRVDRREVATPAEAEAVGFRGSPTILVDGRDPFADPDAHVGLSCRLFRSAAGLAGAPSVEELLEVLQ